MSIKVRDIDRENHTYYIFNDIVNVENFVPNNIKIYEKSYKKITIFDM